MRCCACARSAALAVLFAGLSALAERPSRLDRPASQLALDAVEVRARGHFARQRAEGSSRQAARRGCGTGTGTPCSAEPGNGDTPTPAPPTEPTTTITTTTTTSAGDPVPSPTPSTEPSPSPTPTPDAPPAPTPSPEGGDDSSFDVSKSKCFGHTGEGKLVTDEGNTIPNGELPGKSASACEAECSKNPACLSFTHTPKWNGQCFLKDQRVTKDTATKANDNQYSTHYKVRCPACSPSDGSQLLSATCECEGKALCNAGQRCSAAESCHNKKGDAASIGIVSQNFMGYYTWEQADWKCHSKQRFANICNAIKQRKPAVLGVQEHPGVKPQDGNPASVKGREYEPGRAEIERQTGLKHADYTIYYDPSQVELEGSVELRQILKHTQSKWNEDRYAMAAIFKHKASGIRFAFFNSHWDHSHPELQAGAVEQFMKEPKYASLPRILVGDFNVWGQWSKDQAAAMIRRMNMKDAVEGKGNTWYKNDNKIDYLLYTQDTISTEDSEIDRTGAAGETCASDKRADHAMLSGKLRIAPGGGVGALLSAEMRVTPGNGDDDEADQNEQPMA